MESNEAIGDEQVLIICEAVNAMDNDKVLLNELTIELREILNKYKLLSTNKNAKEQIMILFSRLQANAQKYMINVKGIIKISFNVT